MAAAVSAGVWFRTAADCDGVAIRSGGRLDGRVRSSEVYGPSEAHRPRALERPGAHRRGIRGER
eukprot:15144909-Alexandrium_andersonii.AAC.1